MFKCCPFKVETFCYKRITKHSLLFIKIKGKEKKINFKHTAFAGFSPYLLFQQVFYSMAIPFHM